MLMASGALLIVGFATAADAGFDQPTAYGLIIAGVVLFVLVVINCLFTKRNAVIPAVSHLTTLFHLAAEVSIRQTFDTALSPAATRVLMRRSACSRSARRCSSS